MLSLWKNCCLDIPQRWVYGLLTFTGLCIGNMIRSALPITITEMVQPKESNQNQTSIIENSVANITKLTSIPLYDWDEYTQGLILSSLFWAYAPAQLFYAPLLDRFKAKYLMAQAIFVPSLASFLTPLAIDWGGSSALIALRFIMGLCSSAMFPSVSAMTPHWTTSAQRSNFGSLIITGFNLGAIFGGLLPAFIIQYSDSGWPAVFNWFGLLGIVWTPCWLLLCYDNPDEHPFVSKAERSYLRKNSSQEVHSQPAPTPYRRILSSKSFWAYVVGMIGFDWTNLTIGTDLPKYMKSVLDLPMQINGYVIAFSCIAMWLSTLLSGWLIARLISSGLVTKMLMKKLGSVVSTIGPASFVLGASYVNGDVRLVIAAFIFSYMLMGVGLPSIITNNLDLSPNYAGALISLANGIACTSGIIGPYIIGLMTTNQTNEEWRSVFWIGFAIALVTSVCDLFYLSTDVQSWNYPNFGNDDYEKGIKNEEKTIVDDGKMLSS